MTEFCAICIDGTEGLMRADDGKLECQRCREDHPRDGGYGFDGLTIRDATPVGSMRPVVHKRKRGARSP